MSRQKPVIRIQHFTPGEINIIDYTILIGMHWFIPKNNRIELEDVLDAINISDSNLSMRD